MREEIRHCIELSREILPQSWNGNLRAERFCPVESIWLKKESWLSEIWITAMLGRTHVLLGTFLDRPRPLVTCLFEVREAFHSWGLLYNRPSNFVCYISMICYMFLQGNKVARIERRINISRKLYDVKAHWQNIILAWPLFWHAFRIRLRL